MVKLSVIDREIIYKFFDISGGYVLSDLYRVTQKNKTMTQKIIFDATGIDIFNDSDFKLSQQKAIEKIIETQKPSAVADMLKGFYDFVMCNKQEYLRSYSSWCYEDKFYELSENVGEIIKKIRATSNIKELPSLDNIGLRILEKDLNRNIENQEYVLVIDRLHTYSLFFLEKLCKNNGLQPQKDPKGHIMFDDMLTQLQNKFETNNILNNFDKETIKSAKTLLQKYNEVRNKQSFAHPNKTLENAKAKYVVESIISLLGYLTELSKESKKSEIYCRCIDRTGFTAEKNYHYMWCICNDCGKTIEGSEEKLIPF